MIGADPILTGATALAEAKAYLRIAGTEEDPLLERLLGSAAELCEQFTGQTLIVRGFTETHAASTAWTRLRRIPVAAITGIETVSAEGVGMALAAGSYAVDIDSSGAGWIRLIGPEAARTMRVRFSAGLAEAWEGIPEPLGQGVIRLAAHMYSHRSESDGAGPPAAVSALWRPYRRMRLS